MSLAAYLPRDRYEALRRGDTLPEHTVGAALFADLAGFTPFTDALVQALGPRRGAEELTGHLNRVYDVLIREVDRYQGSVVSFSGDAMTCWFALGEGDGQEDATRRAVACALALHTSMPAVPAIALPRGEPLPLGLKVAVTSGAARRCLVGDPDRHVFDVLIGAPIDRLATAEHLAGRGEVLLDAPTAAALGATAQVAAWRTDAATGEHYALLAGLTSPVPEQPWGDEDPILPDERLRSWLLPAIYARHQAGLGDFLTELRPVVALFLRFAGIDYEADADAGTKLDRFIRGVQAALARYDGALVQLSVGDKGSYLLAVFGAPVAHEDDASRAVSAALTVQRLATDLAFLQPVQIGLSGGVVRAGSYGGATRRIYGVQGDEVNLAARLMGQAAPGEVLLSGRVRTALGGAFGLEPLPPLPFKGLPEPIPVFRLGGQRAQAVRLSEPSYALPMVGRAAELQLIEAKLELALGGQGQVVGITAEAGLGKSRLVAEVIRLARRRGLRGFGGACQSYGTSTPYLVWGPIWRGFFNLDPEASPRRQLRALAGEVEDLAPDRLEAVPLLGPLLGLVLPDNDFTRPLEPQYRKSALEALLLDCLRAAAAEAGAEGSGLLFVLEDLHWIDATSHDLLDLLAKESAALPVLLVLAYRPPELLRLQAPRVEALPHFTRLSLAPLTAAEAESVIRAKLAQLLPDRRGLVTPDLVARITARAQGNPFYVEELLNYLHDRGIDPRDAAAPATLELPTSLHSLILSRIDQLSASQQVTLKVASVLGRLVRFAWLQGGYPMLGASEQLKGDLDELSRLELTPLDTPEPELTYLFKHVVTQEVAYESMAVATRAVLHEQIGAFVERRYGADLGGYTDVLAFHFGRSRNTEKQRHYFRRAGDSAANAYANQTAIDYYQRLLPLLSATEKADVLCPLGQIHQLIGNLEEAERCYREALALAESVQLSGEQARCRLLLGHLMWYKADCPAALVWLAQARAGFEECADRSGVSQAIGRMGLVYWLQADYPRALDHFEQWARIAEELGDGASLAEAVGNVGNVYAYRGDYEQALEHYRRQLALAGEAGNRRESLNAIGSIGLMYIQAGNYPGALEQLARALAGAAEIGDRHTVMIAAVNIGVLYRLQGDHGQALAAFHFVLDTAIKRYERAAAAVAVGNIAWTFADQGLPAQAEQLFTRAIALAQALNIPYYLVDALYGKAELYARRGDHAAAQVSNDEALRIASEAECVDIQLKAQILSLDLCVPLGQTDRSAAATECEALLEQRTEPSEHAAVYYALWHLTNDDEWRLRAVRLYTNLYGATPNVEYRERLAALGEAPANAPDALPPLPAGMTEHPAPLDMLLSRVDSLIAASGLDGASMGGG